MSGPTWRSTAGRFFKLRTSDKTKIAEALGYAIDLRDETDLQRWIRFLRSVREDGRAWDLERELSEVEAGA